MISPSTNLYVIGEPKGPVKIGLATNPDRRLRSLQTGSSRKVRLLLQLPVPTASARDIERRAHWLLRDCRAHGEWFTTGEIEATEAARAAVACNGEGEKAKASVGRTRINGEQTPARFPEGTLARIDEVLAPKENRSDFIREAVERELARRIKASPRTPRDPAKSPDAE